MQTGLFYNSLDECLKAEEQMRAEWERVYGTMPKKFQEHSVVGQEYVHKQMTSGTCIPHADRTQ